MEAIFVHGDPQIRLDYTPDGADVANGEIVSVGGIAGVCTTPEGIEDGELGAVATMGIWSIEKDGTSGPVFSVGEPVAWDVSANLAIEVGSMAAGDFIIGTCVQAAGTNDDRVMVLLNVQPAGGAGGMKLRFGQHTTVAASDTVVTGLNTVVAIVAQLNDDPVDGAMHVTASIGDQAGAPAAGSVLINTWKSTDGDATLVAATTFSKKVNWIAIGT